MTPLLSASLPPSLALVQESYSITTQDGTTITGMAPAMSLSEAFAMGGFMMWPITFCALMVLSLTARSVWRLRSDDTGIGARATIDGSLFWGGYAMGLGILGTVVGLVVSAQAVEAVGVVEPTLVWGGIKISLFTTIYGMLIFLGSGLAWYSLRYWHRRSVLSGD